MVIFMVYGLDSLLLCFLEPYVESSDSFSEISIGVGPVGVRLAEESADIPILTRALTLANGLCAREVELFGQTCYK